MNLNLEKDIKKIEDRIEYPEQMLGKGLNQPFNNTNSGVRKIMFGTHSDHRLPLVNPENPIISTGYELQFGRNSSSYVESDDDYIVMDKIPKFTTVGEPQNHYYTLIYNRERNVLDVIERIEFNYITETYGYTNNNYYMDNLNVGDTIHKGDVIKKSTSFDEYNGRMDGVNLLTAYLAVNSTMEDGIQLSESAAKKLASPLFKYVTIIANENDCPLNLYGDNNEYKCMPYVGEEIKNGILMGLRRENKEESLFTQTANRLKDINMSDDKFTLTGEVVDVTVYCNNIRFLSESPYYKQIYEFYQEQVLFCNKITKAVDDIIAQYNCALGYNLQKLYYNSKGLLEGKQYIKDRKFSNVLIEVTVMERKKISIGDKMSDRYGGKGVVSAIVPDELMPMLDTGERVELINNTFTCINRENPGQLFETSITHIGHRVLQMITKYALQLDEALEIYIHYIKALNPELGDYIEKKIDYLTNIGDYEELKLFLYSVADDRNIMLSLKPISNSSSLNKLAQLYEEFPYALNHEVMVPIISSTGEVQLVKSRRPITCGYKYFYRLKQYAEDKFSVTSLSSTNLKNNNSRSRASKAYKSLHARTPIRFGEMEIGDEMHLGPEYVIIDLMLSSASPQARRLVKENYTTSDPFNVDIKLDVTSRNRNAEICTAYMKTMGLRLNFIKKAKKLKKPFIHERPYRPAILRKPFHQYLPGEVIVEHEDNVLKKPFLRKPLIHLDEKEDENENT